jgi:ornithine cyclodeaminase/alanine dehydrogenase-like protein (mu-crystallin family)
VLLTRGDVRRLLNVDRVIEVVADAFRAYSSGRTQTPLRVGVEPPEADGVLLAMPSAVAEPRALGAKIVSVFRGNPVRGLPTISSLYVLSDYETGVPLAIMDGGYLTAIRTAAGSAVATRALARADARTLGLFGTGVQARFHLETLRRVRPLEQVLVAATSWDKASAFADWVLQTTGLNAIAATAAEASAADIVAACTTSKTPVVVDAAVRAGSHVNAVGAFTPTTRELPSALVARGRVVVDTKTAALAEAGDLLLAVKDGALTLEDVAGELGEVLLGTTAGRTVDAQVTIYKSVGAAFLDAATARLAFEQALLQGLGTPFEFGADELDARAIVALS